jgi:hypothetical protein
MDLGLAGKTLTDAWSRDTTIGAAIEACVRPRSLKSAILSVKANINDSRSVDSMVPDAAAFI